MEKNKTNKVLKLEDYELKTILGSGSFGKVRLVKRKKDNKYSCVKIMKKQQIIKVKQTDHIINQFEILSSLSHPFIVNLEGVSQTPALLYFFMEYVPGGELFTHLREEGTFQPHKAADLKPENVLIAADGYIKLTDFGFAKVVQNRTFTLCGTPQYLAPQILLNQGHGKPVDWWTLGVILYEMLAGIDPFNDDDPMIIYQNIIKGKLKFPSGFDADAKSLVKHLLVADLSSRYGNLKNGANDIKKHRYLNTINFTNLIAKKISPPYKPTVKDASDTSNFTPYDDSGSQTKAMPPSQNPFKNWQ